VKLDRALIAGIASSPYEYGLARAILELLESAALRIVAEGIETEAQVAHLRAPPSAERPCTVPKSRVMALTCPWRGAVTPLAGIR
jgi:predicted signal transduction protein with EAL and GGDEF domain